MVIDEICREFPNEARKQFLRLFTYHGIMVDPPSEEDIKNLDRLSFSTPEERIQVMSEPLLDTTIGNRRLIYRAMNLGKDALVRVHSYPVMFGRSEDIRYGVTLNAGHNYRIISGQTSGMWDNLTKPHEAFILTLNALRGNGLRPIAYYWDLEARKSMPGLMLVH